MMRILEDVHVFDPNRRRFLAHTDVLLHGDRIRRVGPTGSFRVPIEAEPLDVHGRYAIPGLVDFHTHLLTRASFRFLKAYGPAMRTSDVGLFMRCFLGYGVTTVRDLGNYAEIFRLRAAVRGGRLQGPRILAAGRFLEGPTAAWPFGRAFATRREAVTEVRRQAGMGADWIKLYSNVTPRLAETTIREAHKQGLRVAGHLVATSPRQAAAMGIDSLEHAYTLLDDGFLPSRWRNGLPKNIWQATLERWLRADFEGTAARQLMARLRRHQIAVTPTMVLCENYFGAVHRDIDRAIEQMPERWRQAWEEGLRRFFPSGRDPEWEDALRRMRTFLRTLHRAGVTLIPGTDTAAFISYVAPGISLHRDLAILESLGFGRAELLALSTAGAAKALGSMSEFGLIAPGRSADFLVVRRNPLDDLLNLREPQTVVVRGRQFPGEMLRP